MIVKTFLSFLSILFAVLMIYLTILNYKKNNFTKTNLLIWNSLWIILILISIRPNFIDKYFVENFKIDIFYVLTILSILILFILSYFIILNQKILEKKIDTIIRAEAIKEILDKLKK